MLTGVIFSNKDGLKDLKIGAKMPLPEYQMIDPLNGDEVALNSLMKSNGLLVIFSSNTCPYVIAWENTYSELSALGSELSIGVAIINSNEAFRENQDTPESMAQKAIDLGYNAPYLIDQNHVLADAFGARTTPHIYLFDGKAKLVYKGAIDDRYEGGKKNQPEINWLETAMNQLAKGEKVTPSTTREIGCSIKRVKK
ncbi:MAG: thioredoxin family protein [Flavobacteriales bacterium]|nr:MAG: thioredoxin family protein [Flavobacteriales bacterium]